MIIKKKSLIVAIISSYVISMVLVLTLVGYAVYIELKKENFIRIYEHELQKLNAKNYSKYINFPVLSASIEREGALKGHPVLEGTIHNTGNRAISHVILKVKFLDKDRAVIYQIAFAPQEPSLGSNVLSQVTIPYLVSSSGAVIGPGCSLSFKKILNDCPKEILALFKDRSGFAGKVPAWPGKLEAELVSLNFRE